LDLSDPDLRDFLLAALAVEVFMVLFFGECKVYDLSTAMFTAFLLGWMARGKILLYHAVFPLACFNRETACFLIVVFAMYGLRRLTVTSWIQSVGYQALAFLGIRVFLLLQFNSLAGGLFWFRPTENLQMYIDAPLQGAIYLTGMAAVVLLCIRRWARQPALLQTAFIIMVPCLVTLYLFVGYTFEIRVFAEIYPVIVAMIFRRL